MHQERIKRIVQTIAETDSEISNDQLLFETGVLDSFALPDLVSALELEFGIAVKDADLRPLNFASVSQIDQYLQRMG